MNGILLAGMLEREAAAIEIMMNKGWPDFTTVSKTRSPTLSIPQQDAAARACTCCIVDLFGLGLRRYSSEAEPLLLQFLAGRPAVLLVWGDGGGWTERQLPVAPGQRVEFLAVPYSNNALRDALQRVTAAAQAGTQAPAETREQTSTADRKSRDPAPESNVPAWKRALEFARRQQQTAAAGTTTTAAAATSVSSDNSRVPDNDAPGSTAGTDQVATSRTQGGGQDVVFSAFPVLNELPQWQLLQRILATDAAALFAIDGNVVFVVDKTTGRIASRRSIVHLAQLQRAAALVGRLQVTPIVPEQVEATLQRHPAHESPPQQRALDDTLWELAGYALDEVRLELMHDVPLQLQRLPNFTHLQRVGRLDVQLATLCARLPQTAYSLLRVFSSQEQEVLRFVIKALVSGVMTAPADATTAAAATTASQRSRSTVGDARRGFFKSFLNKLVHR